MLLTLWTAMNLTTRLIAAGSVVVMIGVAYWSWHSHVYDKGYDAAVQDYAIKDAKAVARVNAAVARVDECARKGGAWNVSTGECL